MDNLNNIPSTGNWGDASARLNDNFSKVQQAVTTVENAQTNNKGYFSSMDALNTAYPSPKSGQVAYVADPLSSTGYYICNVSNGAWVKSTVEAPPVLVDIDSKADHGYTGTPKTLKEVEDEIEADTSVFNVDDKAPLEAGYHTLVTAFSNVPVNMRKKGIIITFQSAPRIYQRWQHNGDDISQWWSESYWTPLHPVEQLGSDNAKSVSQKIITDELNKSPLINVNNEYPIDTNQYYSIPPTNEVIVLVINSAPISEGDLIIMLDDLPTTVHVSPTTESTPELVAAKIISTDFDADYMASGSKNSVSFRANSFGFRGSFSFNPGSTGIDAIIYQKTKGTVAAYYYIPLSKRKKGLEIIFEKEENVWSKYQFVGNDISGWFDSNNWQSKDVSNELGDSDNVTVSQKVITNKFNEVTESSIRISSTKSPNIASNSYMQWKGQLVGMVGLLDDPSPTVGYGITCTPNYELIWGNTNRGWDIHTTGEAVASARWARQLNYGAADVFSLIVYVHEPDKVNSLLLYVISDIGDTWVRGTSNYGFNIKKGWNIFRFPCFDSNTASHGICREIRVGIDANAATTVTVGKVFAEVLTKTHIVLVSDGAYKTLYDIGYPDLESRGIPVTWALNPYLSMTGEPSRISEEEIQVLSSKYNVFSMHSWASQSLVGYTSVELIDDCKKCLSYLQRNGLLSDFKWRAAWTQGIADEHEATRFLFDAYRKPGTPGDNTFPSTFDFPMVGRSAMDIMDIDAYFDGLRKIKSLSVPYIHGISDNQYDVPETKWDYFIQKADQAINEGYVEFTTMEELYGRKKHNDIINEIIELSKRI